MSTLLVETTVAPPAERRARHEEAATRALRDVLDRHGLPGVGAGAEVVPVRAGLRVELRPAEPIPRPVAAMAAVRAVGAIRAFDPEPNVIDVTLPR